MLMHAETEKDNWTTGTGGTINIGMLHAAVDISDSKNRLDLSN